MLIYQDISDTKNGNKLLEGFYDVGIIDDSDFCNNFNTYGLHADTEDKQLKLNSSSNKYCSKLLGENIILIEKMNIMEKFKSQLLKFGKTISESEKKEYDNILIHFNFYTSSTEYARELNKVIEERKMIDGSRAPDRDITTIIYQFFNKVSAAIEISDVLPNRIDTLKNMFKDDILNVHREVDQLYDLIIKNNNLLTDSFEIKKNYKISNSKEFYDDIENTQKSVKLVVDYKSKIVDLKYLNEDTILNQEYKDDILKLLELEKKTIGMLNVSQANVNNLVDNIVIDNGIDNTVVNNTVLDNGSSNTSGSLWIVVIIIFIILILLFLIFLYYNKIKK